MKKPIASAASALLAAALVLAACTPATDGGTYYVQLDLQRQNVYVDGETLPSGEFTELSAAMRAQIVQLENQFSTDRPDSDLSAVNAAAAGEPVSVQADTMETFLLAEEYAAVTEGNFSPALFPLTELWGFSPAHEGHYNDPRPAPDAAAIAAAQEVSDLALFTADTQANTICKQSDAAKLDFGGIAKGYMSDRLLQLLRERYEGKQIDALFSVMSNHILLGQKVLEDGTRRGYTAAIENPRNDPASPAADALFLVGLSDCALTTSADNYRFYIEGERLYPHIIDADTGEPADNGIISITIVMPLSVPHAGAFADALSTAGFCMPLTQSLAFYEQINSRYGASAVIVTADFRYYTVGNVQVLGRKAYAQYANDNLGASNNVDAIRDVFTYAQIGDASDTVTPCAEELAYRARMREAFADD